MSAKINSIVEQIKELNRSDRWELLETLEHELSGDTALICVDIVTVMNYTGLNKLSDLSETKQRAVMCEVGDALNELMKGLYRSTFKKITKDYIKE